MFLGKLKSGNVIKANPVIIWRKDLFVVWKSNSWIIQIKGHILIWILKQYFYSLQFSQSNAIYIVLIKFPIKNLFTAFHFYSTIDIFHCPEFTKTLFCYKGRKKSIINLISWLFSCIIPILVHHTRSSCSNLLISL